MWRSSENSRLAVGLAVNDSNHIKTFTMRKIPGKTKRMTDVPERTPRVLLFIFAALLAAPATAEKNKTDDQVSLTVTSFERLQQYPPPPAPPRVFVVNAGAGHELAVITLKVAGSAAFDDYKMSAGASLIEADGTRHSAALSKPYKAGVQPEVWDKHILVFPIKKAVKLKSLSVGEMTFDLSKIQES